MEYKAIVKNNKLIAEYMGYKYVPFDGVNRHKCGWWLPNKVGDMDKFGRNYLGRRHKDLDYHHNWNSIMLVVNKIFNDGWVVVFYGNMCSVQDIGSFTRKNERNLPFFENYSETPDKLINAVWMSIIDFINYKKSIESK